MGVPPWNGQSQMSLGGLNLVYKRSTFIARSVQLEIILSICITHIQFKNSTKFSVILISSNTEAKSRKSYPDLGTPCCMVKVIRCHQTTLIVNSSAKRDLIAEEIVSSQISCFYTLAIVFFYQNCAGNEKNDSFRYSLAINIVGPDQTPRIMRGV